MAIQVHLRLTGKPQDSQTRVSWLSLENGQAVGGLKQGDLAQVAADIGASNLLVYLPGIEVLLSRVQLPSGRRSQLLRALPYALEDDLVQDVEEVHCVLGPRQDDNHYIAAVIARETLQEWLDVLQQHGLRPRIMLPDTLLLPWQSDTWHVWCEEELAWIRSGPAEGYVCTRDSLEFLLAQAIENSDTSPASLRLYHCDSIDETALCTRLGLAVEKAASPPVDNMLGLLLQEDNTPPTALNLLQDNFAPGSQLKQQLRPWFPVAALALVLLAISLAGNIIEYRRLDNLNQQLEQQIVKVFRQTFPDVKRVVNPQAQMKHRLRQLRGSSNSAGPSFNEMIAQVAPVLAKSEKLNITNLRFVQGQMQLKLELPDLQSLEKLKQALVDNTDWKIELKSANATEDKVEGRIVISQQT